MATEGGKYKVKKTTYGTKKKSGGGGGDGGGKDTPDPIDKEEANEMLRLMGGVIQVGSNGEYELTFPQLETWMNKNCHSSVFERYQRAQEDAVGGHLMVFLERLIIASSCGWTPPGYKGEADWSPPVVVEKKKKVRVRDKEASTELAFWRHDPRLEGYNIEEVPVPQLNFEQGKGCGIRVDMNMMITDLRAGRYVLVFLFLFGVFFLFPCFENLSSSFFFLFFVLLSVFLSFIVFLSFFLPFFFFFLSFTPKKIKTATPRLQDSNVVT
jgi:hypothetical protein